MPLKTALVFGAGATAACGGPTTENILPDAYAAVREGKDSDLFGREDFFVDLATFLREEFHVDPFDENEPTEAYPPLPMLLGLVDTALDRKQPLGLHYGLRELRKVRQAVGYAVFAILDYQLRGILGSRNLYREALEVVRERTGEDPVVITLNWFYCPSCSRLSLGISRSLASTYKVTSMLFNAGQDLDDWYTCQGRECESCREAAGAETQAHVEPLLITPTHLKDYRNPHIARLWYLAERNLREADRVVFVGYSLPSDDLEVAYMLKRGLAGKDPSNITVVQWDPRQSRSLTDHEVGRRYKSLLGVRPEGWRTDGFEGWITNANL